MLAAATACARVWEFSKFLLEVAKVDDVGARFDGVVTYHDSCHALRELGIKDGPRTLLSKVRGPDAARNGRRRRMLRLRRNILGEISRGVRRHGPHQDRIHSAHQGGHRGLHRFQLPDATARRDATARGCRIRTMHLAEVLASR